VTPQKINAREIRARLDGLIVQADKIEPNLAKRLIDLRKWIKEKKMDVSIVNPMSLIY
jgi:hypothetical protein